MNRFTWCLIYSGFIILGFTGFVLAFPQTFAETNLDIWNYAKYDSELEVQNLRLESMDRKLAVSRQRHALLCLTVNNFLDNRLSFAEAVHEFAQLDSAEPEIVTTLKILYKTEDEKKAVAQQFLANLYCTLREEPDRYRDLIQKHQASITAILGADKIVYAPGDG